MSGANNGAEATAINPSGIVGIDHISVVNNVQQNMLGNETKFEGSSKEFVSMNWVNI